MFQTRAKCGWCQESGDFLFSAAGQYQTPEERERPAGHENDVAKMLRAISEHGGMVVRGYAVSLCPACRQPNLLLFRTKQEWLKSIIKNIPELTPLFGGGQLVDQVETFPRPISATENPHWPEKIAPFFRDAQLMLAERKNPALIVAACRSALEGAARELGAEGANLAQKIDSLFTKHLLTKAMQDWAHRLRLEGNVAVHEIEATHEQAAELIRFVVMFLDMCFTIPKTIEAVTTEQ